MRIGTPPAILTGDLTVYPIGFVLFVAATAIPQMLHELDHPTHDDKFYKSLPSAGGFAAVWVLLLLFYVLHLFRSPLRQRDFRTRWVLAFLVFGSVAELVYWWRYVWPHKSAATLSV